MKKAIFLVVVVAILAAVNVKLAFNSNESVVSLSLASITALAQGESGITCSICGEDIDACNCDIGITCDYGSCTGKVCHENTYDPSCWCRANGDQYSSCI